MIAPVLLVLLGQVAQYSAEISFATYYANSMVLQAEPHRAVIWGYGDDISVGQNVTVTFNNKQYTAVLRSGVVAGRTTWNVTLDAQTAGGPHVIQASSEGEGIELADVMFGDVWVCSGQSNMEHTVFNSDDAVDEIGNATNYQNVRLFRAGKDTSYTPRYDLAEVQVQWTRPNENNIGDYSAVCWLFGRRLFAKLNKPIGLIQSAFGGTRIEAWSSSEALSQCPDARTKRQLNPNEESVLWNAMMHPFTSLTIKGAIWYQGESNRGNPDKYNCSFPVMIKDWRKTFNQNSGGQTNDNFPFGFVQLAPNKDDPSQDFGFPDIRWAQTASQGYVPNTVMDNVFMAVAMDLPDFDSPTGSIHPTYKQDIGRRLSISGLTVAYGQDMGRWYGPRPSKFTATSDGNIEILFEDGKVNLQFKNGNGYEVCCSPIGVSTCDESSGSTWQITTAELEGTSTVVLDAGVCDSATSQARGVRYAWRESPCQLRACSVYSNADENEMPTPPFVFDGRL